MSETETTAQAAPAKKPMTPEKRTAAIAGGAVLLVILVLVGGLYWRHSASRIQIDKADVEAPRIELAPSMAGTLQELDVRQGDMILPDTVVARVDNQIIKSKVGGLVIETKNDIGKRIAPNEFVVAMIDPRELRVVGRIEENKGLQDVYVGQRATFTVDAFGSRVFYGTVDQVAPTARSSDIVFSISDKRATQEFNIYVRFNPDTYPELKNGMSAKLTILKN